MKIVGITRVRNEEHIIADTLNKVGEFVDSIYVYDDCSTDSTVAICQSHPKVVKVIRGQKWADNANDRNECEGSLRQIIYKEALKENPDWIYYFDADEIPDFSGIDFKADAYKLRLFDYYMTPNDKNKHWSQRKKIGQEYREILMLFRPHPDIIFYQREPNIPDHFIVENAGFVKHYGKAISTDEWEKTCDYYVGVRWNKPEYRSLQQKWIDRIGKSIHEKSDFGNDLINWNEKEKCGIVLTREMEGRID